MRTQSSVQSIVITNKNWIHLLALYKYNKPISKVFAKHEIDLEINNLRLCQEIRFIVTHLAKLKYFNRCIALTFMSITDLLQIHLLRKGIFFFQQYSCRVSGPIHYLPHWMILEYLILFHIVSTEIQVLLPRVLRLFHFLPKNIEV